VVMDIKESLTKVINNLKKFETIIIKFELSCTFGEDELSNSTHNLVCMYYATVKGVLDQVYQELCYVNCFNPCRDFMVPIHQFYESYSLTANWDWFSTLVYLTQRINFFEYWIKQVKPNRHLLLEAGK
jgi:hypothetical protein